ncbi:MAG: Na+/H+ antiporter NhaA [Alphaproteobacteria bacterium]
MDIRKFLQNESASGIILFFAAVTAFALSNSPLQGIYNAALNKEVVHWINDGLMAIFFLLIGLEVKREVLEGELSTRAQAALPVIAALGGIVVPALIYTGFNAGDAAAMRGWAIPVATDIAFAVGVLALLADRVPFSLKILLLSLAIVDDIAAILIIAVFYTGDISFMFLNAAAAGLVVNLLMNRQGVRNLIPYLLVGLLVWLCIYKSGVHATIAGVMVALTIPLSKDGDGPLEKLEHVLHPYVAFLILPLFAFANAGVNVQGISFQEFLTPVPLGIAAGLFFGKQIGVFSFIWLGTRLRICSKPVDAGWLQLYGVSVLTGIGFTMSLFLSLLAFGNPEIGAEVRLAVFAASFLSALIGYSILRICKTGSPS